MRFASKLLVLFYVIISVPFFHVAVIRGATWPDPDVRLVVLGLLEVLVFVAALKELFQKETVSLHRETPLPGFQWELNPVKKVRINKKASGSKARAGRRPSRRGGR